MAFVTSQLTRIHDVEGALTLVSIGGGAGAGANTEIFIQGAQSAGRKQSNQTLHGFWLDDGAGNDLSANDIHVKMWALHVHYAVLTALQIWLGDSTTVYDQHAYPLSEYPALGGWRPIWIDVSRTPDATAGGGSGETAIRYFGLVASLPSVGGNAPNIIMDAIDYTTTGLTLTGTNGIWSDFTSVDNSSSNKYGVIQEIGGIYNCFARLTLGSSSALTFNDSNFVIVFPQQSLIANNFMGISCNLQNTETNIDWTNGVVKSAGVKQGDLNITGISGTFDAVGTSFSNLRLINLTNKCTLDGCLITSCDKLLQSGSILDTCVISNATTSDGEGFIISNNLSLISDCSFTFSDGHAIEINTAGTYTFAGNIFTGYGATDSNDAAIFNSSSGSVTINVTAGGSSPTYRNGPNSTTTVNATVQVTLSPLINGSEVRVYLGTSNNPTTATEIAGVEEVVGGQFVFSHGSPGSSAYIIITKVDYEHTSLDLTLPTSDSTIPIQQRFDRNYKNP